MQDPIVQVFFEVILWLNHILSDYIVKKIGQQITDENGVVFFDTIYPGWDINRAPHIHVKVHIGATSPKSERAINTKDGDISYTGQLYFDDRLTDKIATVFPYSTNSIRRTRNEENGSTMSLSIQFLTNKLIEGLKTEVTLDIDPTARPTVQYKASKVL
jgi:protocatechuate 3,4-dioxygenase beta subunit